MENIYSIEQVNEILTQIADDIPHMFYKGLNGGIILEEDSKLHDDSLEHAPMYILGQYIRDILGAKIKIYYGSFMEVYPFVSVEFLENRLKEVLYHELLHHVEYLAGMDDLAVEDEIHLKAYLDKFNK
ncbi:MAG: metallopeptidase family protein [Tissierellia bacterium]|nr:metallopeptidase family protein [Tissierellia bacterium]